MEVSDVYKKVAALYDIHGNSVALEAVLEEVDKHEVDIIIFGGDLAWGPEPLQVMEKLYSYKEKALFIQGNADREVANRFGVEQGLDPVTAEINLWCVKQLQNNHLNFLSQLPDSHALQITGQGEILFVHGSPRSDEEAIRINTPEIEILPMIEATLQHTIVCGHTHVQFDRIVANKRIINTGSVGLPSRAQGACWAVISDEVRFIETMYDKALAAERIKESGVPYAEDFVEHILNPPQEGP